MKRIIVLLAITHLAVHRVSAQIEGNVIDTAGKAISNATIIAIDSVKNTTDTVISDKIGFFAYKKLKMGTYKIVAKANGFQNTINTNIVVSKETPADHSENSDISSAVWLEVILKPLKIPIKK